MSRPSFNDERPGLLMMILQYFIPIILLIQLFIRGIGPTLWHMLFHPLSIPFPSVWHKKILNAGQPALLADADRMYAAQKREVVSQAYGRVLEIGAGTGETVKYYDKGKVDVVYGVEPNLEALGGLRKALVKYGMVEKYEILPFGVEEDEKMANAGVYPGSVDCIVCVSIPSSSLDRVDGR
jgi:hypothetical protein